MSQWIINNWIFVVATVVAVSLVCALVPDAIAMNRSDRLMDDGIVPPADATQIAAAWKATRAPIHSTTPDAKETP